MTHKAFYLAIVLSTGVHLVVLLPMLSDRDAIIIDTTSRPASNFAIVVTTEQKTAIEKPSVPVSSQPNVVHKTKTNQPKPKQLAKPQQTNQIESPITEHAEQELTQQNKAGASTDIHAQIDHDMLNYLHSEFQMRFRYPLLARKRGWSGEVVIALDVSHSGKIDHIVIQKSSGYPLLDNNAVKTFKAIGMVSPAIRARIDNTHHLSIPVIYKLTGG